MKVPKQSKPVIRGARSRSPIPAQGGIAPSDPIGCGICLAACSALPWPASIACRLACNQWACP